MDDCRLKYRDGLVTLPSAIENALADGDKLDSNDLFLHARMWRPNRELRSDYMLKKQVDDTLYRMCKDGRLRKSKTYMSDENVSSTQSKFIYFLP